MKTETKTKEMSAAKLADMFRQLAALMEEEYGNSENLSVTLTKGKSYMKIQGRDADGSRITFSLSNGRAAV
jgi:hypothetical protein